MMMMTVEDFQALVRAGVLSKVELIDGHVVMGDHELIFSPAQAAAAAEVGVRVPCYGEPMTLDEFAGAAAPTPGDTDEQVRHRLALMTALRERGDGHARAAVNALRSLAAQLRVRARP